MPTTALERILTTERFRQRAARNGGFSTPSLGYVALEPNSVPILVTNARGSFALTRTNKEGFAPFGFTACSIADEGALLLELHRTLRSISVREGWNNRCKGIPEAVERLRNSGIEPKSLVVSGEDLRAILGEKYDAETVSRTMAVQGYVTVVDGMQVLLSDLPTGSALVAASPTVVGVYTRVADHLGLLFRQVNRLMMVIDRDVA
jgi:hypothetical protein